MTDLQIELGHPEDAELLKKCAETLEKPVVQAASLARFGYSGADLFLADFGNGKRRGYPRVVKIGSKPQINEEVASVRAVRNDFVDAEEIQEQVDGKKRAAIIYRLISSKRAATDTSPLKDRLCLGIDDSDESEKLKEILGNVYRGCCHDAHNGERTKFTLGVEYERYRRHDRCVQRLEAALGSAVQKDSFEYLGAEIVDPRKAVADLEDIEVEGVFGAVHGDLHPSNVMLDHNADPHLIDFAWACAEAHVLKDFILMECSLRFLVFPSFADLDLQLKADTHLLEQAGWEKLLNLDPRHPLSACYRRLGALIGSIRTHAAEACGPDFDFDREYLAPQFFMLYGLLAYDDYAFYSASRAVGMIAHRLASSLP